MFETYNISSNTCYLLINKLYLLQLSMKVVRSVYVLYLLNQIFMNSMIRKMFFFIAYYTNTAKFYFLNNTPDDFTISLIALKSDEICIIWNSKKNWVDIGYFNTLWTNSKMFGFWQTHKSRKWSLKQFRLFLNDW